MSWDEDDQDKALAFLREKAKVCSSCGTREEEWEQDKFAYIADTKRCLGCEVIEQEQENVPQNDAKGIKIFLVKNGEDVETSDGVGGW